MPLASGAISDPASYRDPSGYVFRTENGRVFRTVNPVGLAAFHALNSSAKVAELQRLGLLIDHQEFTSSQAAEMGIPLDQEGVLLEHSRIEPITYPYEWPFAALKAAALAHLDVNLALLEDGLTLSDASAFNIQFRGPKPVFIDLLSIRPYQEGEYWLAHSQFVTHFLAPLAIEAYTGVPFSAWLRAEIEGMSASRAASLLPMRARFNPGLLLNIFATAGFERKQASAPPQTGKSVGEKKQQRKMPKATYISLLTGMRKLVAGLNTRSRGHSAWDRYSGQNSYSSEASASKLSFVEKAVSSLKPKLLIDLGCNDGAYSRAALAAGAQNVIAADTDRAAIDSCFHQAAERGEAILTLHQDIVNPSPGQGWAGRERSAFTDRVKPDALLALALIHHIVIGRNVPLGEAVGFLIGMAPAGVIEFVPKSDPMVQTMLQQREDIFPNYTMEAFISEVQKHSKIVSRASVENTSREMVFYQR